MLPPVEKTVLEDNPEFAAMYSTLTTAILNPDGTTRDDQSRAARERDAVRKASQYFHHSPAPKYLKIRFFDQFTRNLMPTVSNQQNSISLLKPSHQPRPLNQGHQLDEPNRTRNSQSRFWTFYSYYHRFLPAQTSCLQRASHCCCQIPLSRRWTPFSQI